MCSMRRSTHGDSIDLAEGKVEKCRFSMTVILTAVTFLSL